MENKYIMITTKMNSDGDPWAPNDLLKSGAKEKHLLGPVGQATDKKLRSQPTKVNSFVRAIIETDARSAIKENSIVIKHEWVKI